MTVRREKRRDPETGAERWFWMVDVAFQHADGRVERARKVSPVQTKRGAQEYERQLRDALLNPKKPRKEVPTFEAFVDERWMPTYPAAAGNRHTTIKEKNAHLTRYLKPLLGKRRLDEIRGEVLDKFFAEMRKKGLNAKTIKNVGATLRRALVSAVEWDVIEAIPRFPKIKTTDSPWDFLTPEESEKVMAAARTEDELALLMFPLHTGARAGEQLALEWGDIDWHNGLVIFRRSSTGGVVGPTKSGRERRVPMTASLAKALKAMKLRQLKSQLVFCRPDGSPLKIDQLHERLWGALRRAGLRRIRWHDLRHTFASQLIMKNVPLLQVQAWMGHSTIAMTMRYAHLAPGGAAGYIAVLDGDAAKVQGTAGREPESEPMAT